MKSYSASCIETARLSKPAFNARYTVKFRGPSQSECVNSSRNSIEMDQLKQDLIDSN